MPKFDDFVDCPRCGFPEAMYQYEKTMDEPSLWCPVCGFDAVPVDKPGDIEIERVKNEPSGQLVAAAKKIWPAFHKMMKGWTDAGEDELMDYGYDYFFQWLGYLKDSKPKMKPSVRAFKQLFMNYFFER